MLQITYALPRRIVTAKAAAAFRKSQDEARTKRAAEQLRNLAGLPACLSDERIFQSRLDQLAGLLTSLKG